MRFLSPAALALLAAFSVADLADAQTRTGRATGSTGRASSGSEGRTGASAGRASESGRIGSVSGRTATARSTRESPSDVVRSRSTSQERARASTGITSRSGSGTGTTTVRSQAPGDRGRTAVSRGTPSTTNRGTVSSNRGIASTANRDITGRTGSASGVTSQSGRSDRGIVYGPPLRGSAVGSSSRDYYGYDRDRYRYYDSRSYARRPRIYPAWPVTLIRTCPFSFGFGWGGGFACFQTYWTGGLFVPVVYSYPSTIINVHTRSSYVTPAVRSSYDVVHDDPSCAIVSIITPGNDGYWKTLRLPANGAVNRDQLQRLISNRLAEGYPFLITDADGVRIEVPASVDVEKVTIDPCR